MLRSQLSLFAILIWGRSVSATYLAVGLALTVTACSDSGQKAAEKAAEAQYLLDNGDHGAARIAIAEALSERDDVAAYHVLRGRIELALASQGAAYDAFSNALAIEATNPAALMGVAQLGLATGHLRESREAAERISTLDPNQSDALLILGIHSMVGQNYEEAISIGDRILRTSPEHEGATVLKARALFMLGRPAEALEALDAAAPGLAGIGLTRLEIFRANRQPEQLSAEFAKLRILLPNDLKLRVDEANFRFKRGERDIAHQLVGQVLASSVADFSAAMAAVGIWREYGSDDRSSRSVREITETGSAAARETLARYFLDRRQVAEARLLIASLPENRALQARLLMQTGQINKARDVALNVLRTDTTNCDALLVNGQVALRRSNSADALRLSQQAASECPQELAGWLLAARAYQQSQQDSGVDRVFRQALDANPQSTSLSAAYIEWLISKDRPREAVATARRLTRYAPAQLSAWRLLDRLCQRYDRSCVAEAQRGMADARTRFAIDPVPGQRSPNGLFGRFAEP